ncbi:hypothetical protein TanjilG_24484 [Lupinus angustifolius]|uniref:Uncharacterized protein n=1 Tax=Lupinus angustifolius TaxID=3871 RepID=A0A1J7HHF8_LUPAN|nr:hypothetical protein TanjilG_24484 [Lupinus angustifolius]
MAVHDPRARWLRFFSVVVAMVMTKGHRWLKSGWPKRLGEGRIPRPSSRSWSTFHRRFTVVLYPKLLWFVEVEEGNNKDALDGRG